MTIINDTVIIGSGPAGLTAAIYLSRAMINPIVFMGPNPGGQLITSPLIENYPGAKSISGCDLMCNMINQVQYNNVELIYESIDSIAVNNDRTFTINYNDDNMITRSILIATGAHHNKLNIPGEDKFSGKGVSWCATCDGPLYKNKRVAVIGGGNTAVIEALFLSNIASEVLLIHRRDQLRADNSDINKLHEKQNIRYIFNSTVTNINGTDKVDSITVLNTLDSNNVDIPIDAVFIAIGTKPSSNLVKDIVNIDELGYIITNSNTETSCSGMFAAGDVVSGSLKQAIYAAGQGALAAVNIQKYLRRR
ncbi:MAG: thioredoxin-disulfide reductase [Alphaproteobacteria bacterium]|nr:thioredoxin-disulfide reductase [Alphaproteobacteria bacterium]